MHLWIVMLRTALLLFVCALLSPLTPVSLSAQLVEGSLQSPAAEAPPDAGPVTDPDIDPDVDEDGQVSFFVEIEVVTVPVTVTDRFGELVTDMNQSEFTILDNGVAQKIEDFELSWDPLSLAVLLETSSRVESVIPEIRSTGILLTQLILGATGEAVVLTFDREVRIAQGFTQNAEDIESAIRAIVPGGDQVRLTDAMARAISLLQRRPQGRRKIIIVISEARDHGSSTHQGFVLRGAQQLGISVYTVSLSTWKGVGRRLHSVSSPFPPGVVPMPMHGSQPPIPDAQTNWGTAANINMLEIITELVTSTKSFLGANPLKLYSAGTGGMNFPSGDKAQMEQALAQIGQELRSQYLISYRPNNLDRPGFHTIEISVSRPNVRTRTRPGYMFTRSSRKTNVSSGQTSNLSEEAASSQQ
ncbi:MAG: VWA domain-containing protein [Acidobacteria bacterium]|nr:VWA domain-containing protein [Acidobacteriota bacterium]